MPSKLILPLVVAALVIAGGAFYGGMRYGQTQTGNRTSQGAPAARGNRTFGAGAPGVAGQGRNAMGGFVAGDVVSKDASSLILKLRDGGSKNIFFSTSTIIGKMMTGSIDDLAPGTSVTVNGTANQDGSVSANTIQVRPPLPMGNASGQNPGVR